MAAGRDGTARLARRPSPAADGKCEMVKLLPLLSRGVHVRRRVFVLAGAFFFPATALRDEH